MSKLKGINAAKKDALSKSHTAQSSVKPSALGKKSVGPELLTDETLPLAIGKLFELNNYEVEYSKKIHGAEVDIVATSKGDPFAPVIYVEATVQYVDNTKYGKDSTKFLLIQHKDSRGVCLSVSTKGFTPDVIERAAESGVLTKSYLQLFEGFEKFGPYCEKVLGDVSIRSLLETYEEPFFKDKAGEAIATEWLRDWKNAASDVSPWLVVLGEYGTGKTALTQKLQSDWISDYRSNPVSPIPFRVELRNFTRQFDARSLIHHFLDTNHLGHLSIDFVFHLIRNRRVLLLLDGYDEMAQFLNARERRTCLAALADLASEGAKGILTSRPNYFTETEELNVFEALYTSLEKNKYYIGKLDQLFIAEEKSVDLLLENYLLSKNERYLRDLSPDQTTALVRRKLADDPSGQEIVTALLNKVFREEAGGAKQALSGKPVIISYLLELVDDLRAPGNEITAAHITEWQIYKLIVDRLMFRDLQRAPSLSPDDRRGVLQKLALELSKKEMPMAGEEVFAEIIRENFKAELRRLSPDERRARQDELFQDLRSSATLTRMESSGRAGWVFSHNSLREYLVAELCVGNLVKGVPLETSIPITAPMRSFVASAPEEIARIFQGALQSHWAKRQLPHLGTYLSLSSDLLATQEGGLAKAMHRVLGRPGGAGFEFEKISVKDLDLTPMALGRKRLMLHAADSSWSEVNFKGTDLSSSEFGAATLDRVIFADCKLDGCDFSSAVVFECDFSGATVQGANFSGVDATSNFVVRVNGELTVLVGQNAIGWLRYCGAITDDIPAYFELQHHPKFSIVLKICENLADQKNSQIRGLTQRGAAQSDPRFARDFVGHLKNKGIITFFRNELASVTNEGRTVLTRFVNHQDIPKEIEDFLRAR